MAWTNSNLNGGFSESKPWLPVGAEHLVQSVAEQEIDPDALLHHYRAVIALRKSHTALRNGQHSRVKAQGDVVYFERFTADERVLCVFNLGNDAAEFTLPARPWDAIGAEVGALSHITGSTVQLEPVSMLLAKAK